MAIYLLTMDEAIFPGGHVVGDLPATTPLRSLQESCAIRRVPTFRFKVNGLG